MERAISPICNATAHQSGNNADSITVSVDDNGNTGTGSSSASLGSINVDITPVNDAPIGTPLITGTAQEGQSLTADVSGIADADGLGSFSYQWLRDGVAITGATGSSYSLGDSDVGAAMSVTVSYVDGNGTAESLTSAATSAVANVNDAPTGTPLITGTAQEGQTLTADVSGIADADGLGSFSYQWLRDGVAITGATGSSYSLGDSDVGAAMSVTVSYVDGNGTAESLTSAATVAVANVNDAPTGTPLITGTAARGPDPDGGCLRHCGCRWSWLLLLSMAAGRCCDHCARRPAATASAIVMLAQRCRSP